MNSLPSPAPSPVAGKKDQFLQRRNTATSSRDFQFSFNEDTTNMYEQHLDDSSMRSTESISDRSLSIISSSTTRSSNSSSTTKSRFNIFSGSINNGAHDKKKPKEKRTTSLSLGFASTGNKRNSSSSSKTKKSKNGSARPSFSSDTLSPTTPPPLPTASAFSAINISDFDDLLKSGGTKKVSLTPNRLKSIEVRDAATVSTIVDSCSTSEEEEEEIISKGREDIKVNSRSDNIARSSSSSSSTITATKKKRSVEYLNTRTSNSPSPSSLPQPPLPPLPRLSREQMSNLHSQYLANSNSNSNQSPPLTPASSLAFRQSSQRSVYSATHQNQACDDNKQQQQQHRHQLSSSYASSIYSSSSSMASSLKSSTTHEEISQRGVPQEFSSLPTLGSHHPHPILRRTSERIPTHSNTLNNTFGGNTSAANNNNRRNVVISQSNTVIGLNLQSAYSSSDSTSTIQPAKPLHCFQRPSSNVLKRASMGSRPPSFHESMFDRSTSAMLLNMSATNCNLHGLLKEGLGNDTEVEQVNSIAKDMRNSVAATLVDEDEDESKQHDMVYVLPAHSSMSYNTLSFSTKQQSLLRQPSLLAAQQEQQQQKFKIPRKSVSTSPFLVNASVSSTITNSNSRGIDQACQTDPLSDFLNTDTYSNEEDEEWFFDEEHEDSVAESERLAVEWLLGCA
ncbi:hypothetical protein BDF20DRAFT_119962 [Mycotypha africana]|uniref:uncharacterized protein n=1 Tax=Mycotypha africana TaxID=64632 RepID=UPI002301FCCE|nr:uncharacterized protein BDF20DRAFT_119962 [Mycotypha africana]KAI8970351.1 hypothetical protein BDF20DRAFT_119962 [Mycotypha africana]